MASKLITVRFDSELAAELEAIAQSKGLTVSLILREATASYIKLLDGRTEEAVRKLISSEYLALAIDLIISTEYPRDRQKLLDEAIRRAEAVVARA